MKVTELMIGDWVINPVHNDCSKIESVYYDKELHCLVGTDGRFPQQYFNPIPLTADILELNGLDPIGANLWCLPYMGNWKLFVGIGNDHLVPNHLGVTIYVKHVHELQHALRLCGLTELADNFKV